MRSRLCSGREKANDSNDRYQCPPDSHGPILRGAEGLLFLAMAVETTRLRPSKVAMPSFVDCE